ncbi:MAG TPA: PUA domain-containing protein [Nitrososphaerales archaeon]|nr:PUA domain-containing protein [Nitrososphaerales archaeon]
MQLFDERRRLSLMFDYVFGRGVSGALPKSGLKLVYSRKSGRVKEVLHDGKLFATVKTSGAIALSVYGANKMVKSRAFLRNCVVVKDDAVEFVKEGRSVFCKYVDSAGRDVLPRSEVAVLDRGGRVIGVGRAIIAGRYMQQFYSGVAVKVRQGAGSS